MIKLLIVEDSSFMINAIKNVISSAPDIEIIGSAKTGFEGIEKVKNLNPDCVTMDINMPGINGVETVKEIMTSYPLPIVMLSAYSAENAELTLKALEYGAVDFVQKPSGEISTDLFTIKEELIKKIRIAAEAKVKKKFIDTPFKPPPSALVHKSYSDKKSAELVVTIGVSTGGPRLLKELIPLFDENLKAAILISQHMPGNYTPIFAEQLSKLTKLEVVEAKDLMKIAECVVYVCPGDFDMTVENKQIILKKPTDNALCTPSVDVMFESVSNSYKKNCLGVVLTGLGADGTLGLKKIKKDGGYVIAQDESTSAVFGMPKSAIETGLVDLVLPAKLIPARIQRWVTQRTKI